MQEESFLCAGHKNDSIYILYIISRTKKLQSPGALNIQETPGYR